MSFIHSKFFIAPLQGNYSEALSTPVRTKGVYKTLTKNYYSTKLTQKLVNIFKITGINSIIQFIWNHFGGHR